MSDEKPSDNPEWPDFIPPDFEQSIDSAPHEQAPADPPPPVTGPVLPPPGHGGQQSAWRDPRAAAGDRWSARRGGGERWFNQPGPSAQPGGWRSWSPGAGPGTASVTNVLLMVCAVVWMLQNLSNAFHDLVMLIPSVAAQEPWRFITSAFSHAPRSLTHIGFNMLTLWLMGRFIEPLLGRWKFLAVYLLSAVGGGALFVILAFPPGQGPGGYGLNWHSGLVGASGAVFGLFGAYMVIAMVLKRPLTSIWVLLGLNVVMMVIYPSIAWQAHLGGFLVGVASTSVVVRGMKRGSRSPQSQTWIGLGVVGVVIIAAIVVKYLTV